MQIKTGLWLAYFLFVFFAIYWVSQQTSPVGFLLVVLGYLSLESACLWTWTVTARSEM